MALVALAPSCKKKEKEEPKTEPQKVYDNYSALQTGNYWIYREYTTNSGPANMQATDHYDSCYIEKDTQINGHTYYSYCEAFLDGGLRSRTFLRDSLSYIVTSEGRIRFSSEDFSNIFRSYTFGPNAATPDTLQATEKMTLKNVSVLVDAGVFQASVFTVQYQSLSEPSKRFALDTWYAKGVGMVKTTVGVFANNPDYRLENRLVRYKVNL